MGLNEPSFWKEASESCPYLALAAAVVRRAYLDLALPSTDEEARMIIDDAYNFLTDRLWSQECLWGEMLRDALEVGRAGILEIVETRYRENIRK